jgi:hypothetical protein
MENFKNKQQEVDAVIDAIDKAERKADEVVTEGYKKIESGVVDGYKKIESGAVDGYKKLEATIVEGFNDVNDKIIEKVFSKDGETLDETKARLSGENKSEQ